MRRIRPQRTENSGDSGDAYREIVVPQKSGAATGAGKGNETRIAGKAFEEGDEARAIVGIDLPATVEALNDQGRGGVAGADIEDGPAGCHEAVRLAGDYGAAGFRLLGDQADVAGAEGRGQFVPGPIPGEFNVAVAAAKGFEGRTAGAGAGEGEVEAAIAAKVVDGRADGIDVVRQAEIAGVEYSERAAAGEGEGQNFGAIRPVIGDVDAVGGNAAGDETAAHAVAEGDDSVRLATDPVQKRTHDAGQTGAGAKDAEIHGDIGVEVHLPDEVARAEDGLEQASDEGQRGWCGQGQDQVRPGTKEAAAESAGEEGAVGERARKETVAEGQVRGADDLDGRAILGIGLGVGTATTDHADGMALSNQAAGQIREELASGCGVGVEKLIEDEDTHVANARGGYREAPILLGFRSECRR